MPVPKQTNVYQLIETEMRDPLEYVEEDGKPPDLLTGVVINLGMGDGQESSLFNPNTGDYQQYNYYNGEVLQVQNVGNEDSFYPFWSTVDIHDIAEETIVTDDIVYEEAIDLSPNSNQDSFGTKTEYPPITKFEYSNIDGELLLVDSEVNDSNLVDISNDPYTVNTEENHQVDKIHSTETRLLNAHVCNNCGKDFVDLEDLVDHLNKVHKQGLEPYRCELCSYRCSLKRSILIHISTNHGNQLPPETLLSIEELLKKIGPSKELMLNNTCTVCGGSATSHIHYGAIVCFSCRAFFRRGIKRLYQCVRGNNKCEIDFKSRTNCKSCRYTRCIEVGMRPSLVDATLSKNTKAITYQEPKVIKSSKKKVERLAFCHKCKYTDTVDKVNIHKLNEHKTTKQLINPSKLSKCLICGDYAPTYPNYGAICCNSCRAFFRRQIGRESMCITGTDDCQVDLYTRTNCKNCRFSRCIQVGMIPEAVDQNKPKNVNKTSKPEMEFKPEIREVKSRTPVLLMPRMNSWRDAELLEEETPSNNYTQNITQNVLYQTNQYVLNYT